MDSSLATLMVFLRFANILVAAYLIYLAYSLCRAKNSRSFSRTNKLLMLAVLLFFIMEFVQIFGIIPGDTFAVLQSVFTFIFIIMLIEATLELKKGVLAHDHLMRRKHKQRMVDVE
ncbi:Uncharacterised protein [uncultured archaeon]|nr:Uncharacterised protein [uncultured archaeon]